MGFDDQGIEYLIIGGGVAGLAAANRLVDQAVRPVVLDAGHYPSHKICGEFFSFECHSILKEWDLLPDSLIKNIKFHIQGKTFDFSLPESARGGSRYLFDQALFKRVEKRGAHVLTNTRVSKIDYFPYEPFSYKVQINEGRILKVKNLFVGTGRILSLIKGCLPPKMRYVGIKGHLKGIELSQTLEMFSVPGGYFGLSPIENKLTNLACLADINAVKEAGSALEYLNRALKNISRPIDIKDANWITSEVPEFCFNSQSFHHFRNLYLIGDAGASIAPASGDGLAMGVTSGVMAADFAIKGHSKDYQRAWAKAYRSRLKWARSLHWLMLHSSISKKILESCEVCPSIFQYLFRKTRGV